MPVWREYTEKGVLRGRRTLGCGIVFWITNGRQTEFEVMTRIERSVQGRSQWMS